MKKGILNGIAAYLLWGVFPIYWKLLHEVPAIQVIGHRIIWSFALLMLFILLTKQWKEFRTGHANPQNTWSLFDCRSAAHRQLAGLCVGCERRIYRRNQPWLFHQSTH